VDSVQPAVAFSTQPRKRAGPGTPLMTGRNVAAVMSTTQRLTPKILTREVDAIDALQCTLTAIETQPFCQPSTNATSASDAFAVPVI